MNLPLDFSKQLTDLLGQTQASALVAALQNPAPTSIRYNPLKNTAIQSTHQVPWTSNGYYLKERPLFTLDPLFHAGTYYVQEASSMILEQAIKQYLAVGTGICALDLCAAPGGKSSHLSALLGDDDLLVSNEISKLRAAILSENIQKWGSGNVLVSRNDSGDFKGLHNFFDFILVDAPCSGEGMFRKDEGAIKEWSLNNVKICAERQQKILANIWDSLKPGGFLFYSTCTYNTTENEAQIAWLEEEFGAEALPLELEPSWGIQQGFSASPCYRLFPHLLAGEGLFCCLLQKPDTLTHGAKKNKNSRVITSNLPQEVSNALLLQQPAFINIREEWFAFDEVLLPKIQQLQEQLYLIYACTGIGQLKGKDWIPAPALALSTKLKKENFPIIDCDKNQALATLSRENPVLDTQGSGWQLAAYEGFPLAWLKVMPNRINNYQPKEWRIRMDFRSYEL